MSHAAPSNLSMPAVPPSERSHRLGSRVFRTLAALLLMGSAACGAAPPYHCETVVPGGCDPGSACWPVDQAGNYQCLEAKTYKPLGSDCALLVGRTTCYEGLLCAPMRDKNDVLVHRCTVTCDEKFTCPGGGTCKPVTLFPTAPQISVCVLPPPA